MRAPARQPCLTPEREALICKNQRSQAERSSAPALDCLVQIFCKPTIVFRSAVLVAGDDCETAIRQRQARRVDVARTSVTARSGAAMRLRAGRACGRRLFEGVTDLSRVGSVRPCATPGLASDPPYGFIRRVGLGLAAWSGGVSLPTFGLLRFFHRPLPSWLCTEERAATEIVPIGDEATAFCRVTVNGRRRMNPAKEGGLEGSPSGRSVKTRE